MISSPLIDAADLLAIIDLPTTRIADLRWYLGEPERGRFEYEAGHLPGAVFVDLDHDLSAPDGPGRHPLPDRTEFAATMGALGFSDDHTVIVYDDRGGVIAARLWWMLRDIGHLTVQLLDGGLGAWVAAGFPVTTEPPVIMPTTMSVQPGPTRQIDRATLAQRLGAATVLDARAPERYRGEVEPIDTRAGHIPTAHNAPTTDNLDHTGRFRPATELAGLYQRLSRGAEVVASCGSGVFACHDILAMTIAGLPEPMLYPGSWSDWSSSGMPIAVGDEPGEVSR